MTTAHEQSKPGEVDDFLAGGGEMGALMRSIDWSQTPMGAVELWPQSLRTAISIMLASRFAMVVAWGPEFRFFYNDRYRPVLGASKHPGALGAPAREIFPEAWPFIGPLFESTREGESVALDDVLIPLDRYGYLENCYFTLSYSPIRAELGGVGGMLAVVAETTERVEGERRLRTLRELAQRPTVARTVEEACKGVAEALGENPIDAPFSLFYLVDPDSAGARLAAAVGLPGGTEASPTTVDLASDTNDGWPLASVARTRKARVVEDLALRFGALPGGPYPEPTHTAVVTPMLRPGQKHVDGLIVFGISPRRALDERYLTFIELATDQTLTAIRNARAYEDERKRAEALAEIDRAKTAFFSNVSHEFRTPLTLMLGPLEDTLAQSDGLPAADRERLEVAQRNSIRLLKLVNTLLDFSRIEAGRTQVAYEPTDLAAFTAELASVFRSAIERAGLRLLVNCSPLEEPVYVDREMWEKVVLNLLSNAFKFTFEGEIEVSLRQADELVELAVRDTGTGIPATELPHVFERFHRVKGARGRTYEGSGIGLALVQELVKLHSGAVRVESEVDRGSTFIVTIPRGSAHLPADRVGAARRQASTTLQGGAYVEEALRWLPDSNFGLPILDFGLNASDKQSAENDYQTDELQSKIQNPKSKILLADDNVDMREYVQRLLSQAYEVIAVNDGAAALRAAREHTPDLVLTDVMMPGLDGFGLLRELRADERLKTIPVIMLSARAGEESRIEGLAEGADDYLVKPFSARELLARVGSHLKLQRMRRQWEAALRASESKFSAAFEQSPLALTISSLADGRLVEVNEGFVRLSGYTREEALGRTPAELKLWVEPEQHAEGLKQLQAGAGSVGVEARFRQKNGAELFGVIRASLIEINSRPHVVSSIADITERKRAEGALRQRTRALEIINRTGTTLAAELDLENLVQAVTDAGREVSGAAFGAFFYNVKNEQGESYMLYTLSGAPRESFSKFPMPRNTAVFDPTFKGQGVIRLGDVLQDPRYGKSAPYYGMPKGHLPVRSYLAVPVVSRSGEVLGGLFYGHPEANMFTEEAEQIITGIAAQAAVALDNALLYREAQKEIAERKQMEEALKVADRRKDEFLAMLAHELRNPLAPIRNAAQVLKLVGPSDANQQWAREVIERQTQHLTKLVDDLLDVSRITQGKVTLLRDPLDLATIINRAVETSRPLMDAHKHHLAVTLPPEPVQVEGDLTRLVQVVGNLLNNAAKYTDDGGHIQLQATQEKGEAVIRVRDDGMGLPADLLPHVFDLFTQAERSLDRSQGGLGIGLTLVRQLVELHGGRVEAKSDGPGRGSEFIVRLPAQSPSPAADAEAAAGEQAHTQQKLRVLVVEDNVDSAELMAFVLELGGHDVQIAHDGPEALEMASAFKPQAILCDIGLPGMNGYEVGARLREQSAFKQTPLIALTGYGQEEARRRAKEAGFDYHLVKPVEPDALGALLDSLLQRAETNLQLENRPAE